MPETSTRSAAIALEQQLRLHAMGIDLAHGGRHRSVHQIHELFHRLVEIVEPALFIEAGAFDAAASCRVSAALPACRVVAFEANPRNYAAWRIERDFDAHRVEYLNLALADRAGPVTFHLRSTVAGDESDWFEDNSILPRAGDVRHTDADLVTVEATTLDEFTAAEAGRAAMWVDVEGANREVLTGGSEFLRRCDVVTIEVEDVPLWRDQWLATDVLEALLAAGLLPVARDVQRMGQYNLVAVRDTALARAEVLAAIEEFLRQQLRPELPGPLGTLRRNDTARRMARTVRGLANRRSRRLA